jgi:uncharacterized protein YukE
MPILCARPRAWDHLAWEIWQLSRALEAEADALAIAWSGAAADAYADVWRPVRRGFYELDEKIHDVSGRLGGTADMIEGGQAAYDRALAAAGLVAAAGIGLTLLTAGLSDVAGAAAEGGIAATGTAIVADLELGMARVATLLAETTEALSGLASRFAVNFALRAPELAYGPVGGGAMGIGVALASGVRDPGDLAASGLLGAAESTGGGRRGAGGGAREEEPESGSPAAGASVKRPDPVEAAWRGSLSPAQVAKQAEYDRAAARRAADFSTIKEPLTPDVARAIEIRMPGTVRYIGRNIVNPASPRGDPLTDLDIETHHVIIQVKSGRTDGLSSQIDRSRSATGKPVVGFAPEMRTDRVAFYRRHGYTVFLTMRI